jgi:hypothetical protein
MEEEREKNPGGASYLDRNAKERERGEKDGTERECV